MDKVLTEEAEQDRADFYRFALHSGCTCFINPPCGFCTHPGNPTCQENDESCWVVDFPFPTFNTRSK